MSGARGRTVDRAQLALMLHSVPHLGPKGLAALLAEVSPGHPGEPVELDSMHWWRVCGDTLRDDYGLHHVAADTLIQRREELLTSGRELRESADRLGIRVLTFRDLDYPTSILEYDPEPPPILYAHGNLGLFRERTFSAVCSSGASGQGLDTTRELAGFLADEGLAAVTSHNTPSYQVVGLAAKSRNAPVLLVLDRGLLTAFPQGLGWEPSAQARIWDLRFDPTRDLVISRFRLYDRWIGANARERDRMVFGLSDVVIAVEVRPGGVMERQCLRAHEVGREVYALDRGEGSSDGNKALIARGCPSFTTESARAVLTTLDLLHEPASETPLGAWEDRQ